MFMKKGYNMQSVCVTKTEDSQWNLKWQPLNGKIECKKYSKIVWNSMSKEQLMQVKKLHEQQSSDMVTGRQVQK